MKRLFTIVSLCLAMIIGSSFTEPQSNKVYICTGSYATAYHKTKDCVSGSCKAEIKEVTLKEAQSMGRKPCKKCYKNESPETINDKNMK